MNTHFQFSLEVHAAIQQNKPVLALESTIITHGMPYPYNLETALSVENIAREQGAIPATIAIMDGKIKIGLTESELTTLAQDKTAAKASVRDIPFMLQQKINAGTTVAATLYAAHKVGINVFATGGIGGVHRGETMDISADLIELAKTPIAVICAGAKAILDLPRTLELMETLSIAVVGYQTDYLPAFYTQNTSYKLPARVDDIHSLAELYKAHCDLGLTSGMLIKNPIPAKYEIPASHIEKAIESALNKAAAEKIVGKEITPFLLSEVAIATEGKSLKANMALIKNNVQLGAMLAATLYTR